MQKDTYIIIKERDTEGRGRDQRGLLSNIVE